MRLVTSWTTKFLSAGLLFAGCLCLLAAVSQPVLETNNAQVETVFTSDEVQNLPSNGRGFVGLASLAPGVAYAAIDSQHTSLWYGTPGGPLSMIAKRSDLVTGDTGYLIDGIESFVGNDSGQLLVQLDAINAFGIHQSVIEEYTGTAFNKVVTSDDIDSSTGNPYGRPLGVSAITKSGTNFFHGRAALYMQPSGGVVNSILKFGAAAPGPQGGTIADARIVSVNAASSPQVLIQAHVLESGGVLQTGLFQLTASPTPNLSYVAVSGNKDSSGNTFSKVTDGFQNDSGQVGFMAFNATAGKSIYAWQLGASAPAFANPSGTIPVPSQATGAPGVLGSSELHGVFNSGNFLITAGVTGGSPTNPAFTDFVVGRYNPFGSNPSFTMDGYDGQAVSGFSARTLSKYFSSFSYSRQNDAYVFKNLDKVFGYGLVYKYGTAALASAVSDGLTTPLGGEYKLANTFRMQVLPFGFRFSTDIAGGPNPFADFQYTAPSTPGGTPSVMKLWGSGDALGQAVNFTFLGKTLSMLGNKVTDTAWHPGGAAIVLQKDRTTGMVSRLFGEFDPVGTLGFLGPLSHCSRFNLDSVLGVVFRGEIRGGNMKIGSILQANHGQLTSLLKTGDPVPSFTGWTYRLKGWNTYLRASSGRLAYTDSPVNPNSTYSLDILGVYDPSLTSPNQIISSAPGTAGAYVVQSLLGKGLKFSYPYALIPAQIGSGSTLMTGYLYFNLSASGGPQVISGGSLFPKGILWKLSSNVDLNSAGSFGYLNSTSQNAYQISLNVGGTTTTPVQDGQSLPGLGDVSLTSQNPFSGQYFSASDFKINFKNDFLSRFRLTAGAGLSNSAYARVLSGGSLQVLAAQGQSWANFGVIGDIPTGTGGQDFVLGNNGNATIGVPFTNLNNQNSRAILWFDASGNGWKAFAAGDTLPSLNQMIVDFGRPLASDPSTGSVGVHATLGGGTEALLWINEQTGMYSTSTSVSSTATSATAGTSVTFTATVANTSSFSGATPTGTVAFEANGVEIGESPLGSAGAASFTTSSLGVGSHNITARYGGDSNFTASLSNPFPFLVSPPVSALPSSLFFGAQAVSTSSGAQTVTLSNAGAGSLTALYIGTSGDFSQTNNCGASLAGMASCPINVTFTSSAAGSRSGTLMIEGNFSNGGSVTSPVELLVPLYGYGTNGFVLPAAGQRYVPVTPCRVADTRNTPNGPFSGPAVAAGTSRDFAIPNSPCGIPSTATAYSLNVAVVPGGPLGFVTVWPTGQALPVVATTNSVDGRVKSTAALVPAGAGGAISVYAANTTNVVIDINGYFVPATNTSALAFYPVTPCRIADTRNANGPLGGPSLSGGQARSFPISGNCGIPSTAQAYSLNFAAVPKGALGYLSAWPAGQMQPLVATLNAVTGTVTANAAIVPAGTGGAIDVFASNDTDLVIDVNGYFAPAGTGGLSLYVLPPCRVADTRQPPGSQPFNGTINVPVSGNCGVPGSAQAFAFNATVVPPGPLGYLTMWPEGTMQPVVATLNAVDGAVTNNLAIVPTTNGSISAYASNPTHLVMDISGYFAP